jgi:hypothetical protein
MRITFGGTGTQGEAEVKKAKADAKAKENVPDFLREVPEAKSVEDFFIGGFVRVWGGWVYITQMSEQQVVAVAKMRLAVFAKWLAVALTEGVKGWSAEPTWGLQTLPRFARADWAASRYGVVFHPEEEEEAPYTRGAFLSAWAAIAVLNGGSYPTSADWRWSNDRTWYAPENYQDAPLVYRGQPLPLAIEKMARDYLEGTSQERKGTQQSKKLFIEEDIPF